MSSPTESREISLISTVELRIACASTTSQLQPLINTYLTPLLLKLGSAHAPVRAKTREVCQHIIVRLGTAAAAEPDMIPVRKLVGQFWDLDGDPKPATAGDGGGGGGGGISEVGLRDDVRRFGLVFIGIGLLRIRPVVGGFDGGSRGGSQVELLRSLLRIPDASRTLDSGCGYGEDEEGGGRGGRRRRPWIQPGSRQEDMSLPTRLWIYGFYFLLKIFATGSFVCPARDSQSEKDMRADFDLTPAESDCLAEYLTRFLLADFRAFSSAPTVVRTGGGHARASDSSRQPSPPPYLPGLTAADWALFRNWIVWIEKDQPLDRGRDRSVASTKATVAQFLFTSIFNDRQRFMAAVVMSADPTAGDLFRVGDTMFKQCDFDLEDPTVVDGLYELYFGRGGDGEGTTLGEMIDVEEAGNARQMDEDQIDIRRTLPALPTLRLRILSLLVKSKMATTKTDQVLRIVQEQFGHEVQDFGREATRLRASTFSLLNWMFSVGSKTDISAIAAQLTVAFRSYVVCQGWPNPVEVMANPVSKPELELRAKAYENMGSWAARIDFTESHHSADEGEEATKLDLVRFLLTSLSCDASSPEIQVSIDLALGRLLNVLAESTDASVDMTTRLRELLMKHMGKEVGDHDGSSNFKTVRSNSFSVVRFANRCLPFDDGVARWIDLLAIGEGRLRERNELIEEGTKGLDPYWWSTVNQSRAQPGRPAAQAPPSPKFAELVNYFFRGKNGKKLTQAPQGIYRFALPFAVNFCHHTLVLEALQAGDMAVNMEPEWEKKTDAILSNNQRAQSSIRSHLREHVDPSALTVLIDAALIGMALQLDDGHCADITVRISSLVPDEIVGAMLHAVVTVKHITITNDLAIQSQAARALGIFASHPKYPNQDRKELIGAALGGIDGWREAVSGDLNRIRGQMLSVAFILSRQALRRSLPADDDDIVRRFFNMVVEIVLESRDSRLRSGAHVSIGQLMLCLDETTCRRLDLRGEKLVKLIEMLTTNANKGQESAVFALGRLTRGLNTTKEGSSSSSSSGQVEGQALLSLLSLHEIKSSEIQFAVGEALSVAAAGWNSSVTIADFDLDAPRPPQPVNEDMLEGILEKVISDSKNPKPSLKKASAIWLLCLVQYVGEHPAVQTRLRQCQAAFAGLLTSRDEIVQEAGSRGLSLVYEMGDKELKDELVRELVASFTGGNVKMGGTVTSDTELFDPGALPTGDGSVTTYKDIVSLASEMGDPSLVYRFMNLASNNAIWTSRSAFGRFGLSNILTDSAYLAENRNFYPKLYRYRFDPNPNVQRSMNDIWNALVKDASQVIDQNFDLIVTDLLKSLVDGKEWRIRQASCSAISELLQGRDVEKYEKYLKEIWIKAFQVLDDIKETVRVAAMSLCRTLTNLLIRNLEVGSGTSSRALKLLDHAMQFLLQQVQAGSAKEVQDYAIETLFKVIKKSPPKALKGYAPAIVETLIMSMTSLEPEAVNYIHLNAEKYGVSAEKLDSMRVSGVSSSPAMRAVERCIEGLDEKGMSEVMERLGNAFKSVIGLPSKVGLSSLLVTLAVRHNFEFRPYADRFAQLLRKHLFDRNETVVNSHCLSLAYLMRLSSDEEVAKTADFTKDLYFGSEGVANRQIAGDIVHAISKVSNDRFTAFASAFLPLAFIGRNDVNAQVREPFHKTWEDNVGGVRAVSLYLMEIVDLAGHLDSPQWGIKHTVSLAVGDLISSRDSVITDDYTDAQAAAIWTLLEKALGGKTWEGKEKVVTAFPRFVKHARTLWESKRAQFEAVAIRETKRINPTYRPHAISALGEIVKIIRDKELAKKTLEVMKKIVEDLADDSADRMEVDGKTAFLELERQRQADLDKMLAAVIESSFKAATFSDGDQKTVSEDFTSLTNILDQSLPMGSRLSHMAMCEGIVHRFSTASGDSRPEVNGRVEEVDLPGSGGESLAAMDLVHFLLPSTSPGSDGRPRQTTNTFDNIEAIRLARAQAVLAIVSSSSTFLTAQDKEAISAEVKTWLDSERSDRLRRLLVQACAYLSAT